MSDTEREPNSVEAIRRELGREKLIQEAREWLNTPADMQMYDDPDFCLAVSLVSRLADALATPVSPPGGSPEIAKLRAVCAMLSEALAKRCLTDANDEREHPNDWPAGQEWDDLVPTSHSIMRHRAWNEAGLNVEAMRALLFDEYGNPKESVSPPSVGGSPT